MARELLSDTRLVKQSLSHHAHNLEEPVDVEIFQAFILAEPDSLTTSIPTGRITVLMKIIAKQLSLILR